MRLWFLLLQASSADLFKLLLLFSSTFCSVLAEKSSPLLAPSSSRQTPTIFNFGDSNSDTGAFAAAYGFSFGPPFGRAYTLPYSGRISDGRLVIDFLCESVNTSYLSPYLQGLGSDFTNGANFAVTGASTLPRDKPFSLFTQTNQFGRFHNRSIQLFAPGSRILASEEGFKNAVYSFDMGQNDLSIFFSSNLTYKGIVQQIPSVVSEIKVAILTAHGYGGRKFWVHNTGPLGCLPAKLFFFKKRGSDVDASGCLKSFNNAAKAFNLQLKDLCHQLRSQLPDATIVYTDIYSIKYNIISNYAKYGFEHPFMACCGFGGAPFNYYPNKTCGNQLATACPMNARRISWDGTHYTQAVNSLTAARILSGKYSEPRIRFEELFHN